MSTDNFFSPSFGNRPSYLVGRQHIVSQFESYLQESAGSRNRSLLCLGQRGMGKTVLLWEFADRARKLGFVVASPTIVSDVLLERIVEKIQDDGERILKEKSRHLSGGTLGALGFSIGLQFKDEIDKKKSTQYKLTQLARALSSKNKGLLILVDEVQANSSSLKQLIIAYQEMLGEGLNVAIAMAGLPTCVSAVLNEKVLTFLNRAQKIEIGALKISDIDRYFEVAFDKSHIKIDANKRLLAAQSTCGSPYLMQLIGYNLSGRADEIVDGVIFEEAIAAANKDYMNDISKATIAALSDKDREFLVAMSKDSNISKISDIAKRMDVSADYAQKYRKRLITAGVIESSARGCLKFTDPLLAQYLREQASLI